MLFIKVETEAGESKVISRTTPPLGESVQVGRRRMFLSIDISWRTIMRTEAIEENPKGVVVLQCIVFWKVHPQSTMTVTLTALG